VRILSIILLIFVLAFSTVLYKKYEKKEREKTELANFEKDQIEINKYLELWDAELRLASSTPRIALSNRVASLQEISRKSSTIELLSPCLIPKKEALKKMTNTYIDGMLAFMRNSEAVAQINLSIANEMKSKLVKDISACKPIQS